MCEGTMLVPWFTLLECSGQHSRLQVSSPLAGQVQPTSAKVDTSRGHNNSLSTALLPADSSIAREKLVIALVISRLQLLANSRPQNRG